MSTEQINNEQPQQEQNNVKFSHRLSPLSNSHSVAYMVDTIDQMTDRAIAILFVLEDNLCRSDDMFNPEIIGNVISAVRLELGDIQQVARAYHAVHPGKNGIGVYEV